MAKRDADEYEKKVRELQAENAEIFASFRAALVEKGLAKPTIRRHVENAEFFLDDYLAETEGVSAVEGIDHVPSFLGFWFIRKAMWASETAIRQYAATFKKLYAHLAEQGRVSVDDVAHLKSVIKEELPEWVETVQRYDDPDITDPWDVWGF